MFKGDKFFKTYRENKKLQYAVNIFILLVFVSLMLKFDLTKFTGGKPEDIVTGVGTENQSSVDDYVSSLEDRMEEIIKKIDGVKNVDVMIYTGKTPELEPVYNENKNSETNIETGSDGIKREVKRETKENEVVLGTDNQVIKKYYQYPDITGVLVVVDYQGQKDIYSILMRSIRTLFNIDLNDIEVVISGESPKGRTTE
jgi:stage III sporulation protein AG